MYCKQCGKQISDDVKFCPRCGAAVGVGTNEANTTSRAQITSDAPSTTPMSGGIAEQVNSSKQHSRRRMPMVLIIILVTLALASAAFAAVYIYTTYIAPAQEELLKISPSAIICLSYTMLLTPSAKHILIKILRSMAIFQCLVFMQQKSLIP